MTAGHVFLSHNHGDKEFVRRLAGDLRGRKVTVWLDEWELRVGDSIVERVQAGILEAGYLAVVLSPRSIQSVWVARELNAAFTEETRRRGIFILPVLLEDCDLPLFVRDKMYADFRGRYADGLQTMIRTIVPGDVAPPKLVFDSRRDDPRFQSWGVHCSDGARRAQFRLETSDNALNAVIFGSGSQSVGLNKSVPTLHGRTCFEYRVTRVNKPSNHVYFTMIPIQETGYGRKGVIEVGTQVAGDPRNAVSPHRLRYAVPISHQTDGLWHAATIDFDFRDTPNAFYAIFGARVNEGSDTPAEAQVELGNVQIYSW